MRKHRICAALLALLFILPTARAGLTADCSLLQDNDTTGRTLSTVTVLGSGNKSVTSAAPLFRLSSSRLERFGFTDMGQALKRLPGITLKDYGGAGGLKTVSVRGLGAAHTAVVYDGVALSECQSGEIDLGRFSPDNIDALSLAIGDNDDIFQPARVLASAASVFVSNTPSTGNDTFNITGRLRAGSFGYVNPFAKINARWRERFAANISADFSRADNCYPFALKNGNSTTTEHRNNSKSLIGNTEANFIYTPDASSRLSAKLYYYDSDRQLPGPVIYYNNDNREKLRERTAFAQTTYRSALSSVLSLLANAKFSWSDSRYSDFGGTYPGGELHQNYCQREAYASAALLWFPVKSVALDYSADYAFNNLSSNLATDTRPWRHSLLQSLSLRWKNRHFTINARALASIYRNGAHSGEAAKNASRLSPSASISYRPFAKRNLFVWRVVNLDKVRGHGLDLSLNCDFAVGGKHSVLLTANYSYQRMEPRTTPSYYGNQIPYIPRNSGGISGSYENPWVNISLSLTAVSARYSTIDNNPDTRIAGYAETGAAIYRSFSIGKCRFEARLDMLNLFDRQYCVLARYPMPGRSFRAGLKIEL